MGDFNIDLLKYEKCTYSQTLLHCIQSFSMLPVVDKPTRVYGTSATLIDNIFTNNLENSIVGGNIVTDITDHFSQVCIIMTKQQMFSPLNKTKVRDYSNFNTGKFMTDLCEVDWNNICHSTDVNKSFSRFYKNINRLINKHAPLKDLSKRRLKLLTKPWLTKGIRRSIRVKNNLFFNSNWNKYKQYRNKLTTLIRLSKQQYYQNFFNSNIKNMRQTWKGINELLGGMRKKGKSKNINFIRSNENAILTNDPKTIGNTLNGYFATVGDKLASAIPEASGTFSNYLDPPLSNTFYFDPIIPQEIESEIITLSESKAYGLYSSPVKLLKLARSVISLPLAEIFNQSILTGIYPAKFKLAKIVPVFKDDDETLPENYRPISLLSIYNRIFEKLIYARLIKFISKNNILYNLQYGFRSKHSTQHAILDIANTINSNMDSGKYTCGIFIDLKKAFDTVNHSILLAKLENYGIRGLVNTWFNSYLTDRRQSIEINNHISKEEKTLCGVPQGSVLGPLLFLLYINDIYKCSSEFTFYLFADDTSIIYANNDLRTLESTVNLELAKVSEWLKANKLTLNIKKSNYVIFRPRQKIMPFVPQIKIFNPMSNTQTILEIKDFVKYLGIMIDSDLSWKNHIDFICHKISKSIGIIAKLRHYIPRHLLLSIYHTLITPYLTYGISAWGYCAKTHLNRLLILQKRVLRLIFFRRAREHAIPLFIKSNCLPISFLFFQQLCHLMHDIHTQVAPINLLNQFTKIKTIHNYNTRSSSKECFAVKTSRTEKMKKSFTRIGVSIWNSIPKSLKSLNKSEYQNKIKKLLLDVLNCEDDYIEVSKLIKHFTTLT